VALSADRDDRRPDALRWRAEMSNRATDHAGGDFEAGLAWCRAVPSAA
jgi:hypothetical protein